MPHVTHHNPSNRPRPSGYSHACSAHGLVVVSGQIASSDVIEGQRGFAEEFASALSGVAAALDAAGSSPADVLSLRMFVTDLEAYATARPALAEPFREVFAGHYPAMTVVEVRRLLGEASLEIEAQAVPAPGRESASRASESPSDWRASIRLRLGPADARYAGGLVPGSKAMEIFADLETEISLLEGGDEGLCAAYDSVEFLAPLHVGDFVEARARVVRRGRSSRKIEAELFRVASVDSSGRGGRLDAPQLAARASATIVVGGLRDPGA